MLRTLRSIREMPRVALLAMLALALLTRLAVPAGWMPVSDAHGSRLTICTGAGPLDAAKHADSGMAGMHHAPNDHKQGDGNHLCPFTAAATALAEPHVPILYLPPTAIGSGAPLWRAEVAIGRGLAAPPPPATGPPSLV